LPPNCRTGVGIPPACNSRRSPLGGPSPVNDRHEAAAAARLRRGTVSLDDFTAEALGDPQPLALAHRLQVVEDDNPDPNALIPQRVEIDLAEGRTVARSVDAVLGSPVRPLAADAMREKFKMCWHAVPELPLDQGAALWNGVSALETLEDVRVLAALASRPRSRQDGKRGREPAV
jgi:2-methylcitrate dehydratase PrpD